MRNNKYDNNLIIKLYNEGKTYREISDIIGCSYNYLSVKIANLGIANRRIKAQKKEDTIQEQFSKEEKPKKKRNTKPKKEKEIKNTPQQEIKKEFEIIEDTEEVVDSENSRFKSYNKNGNPTMKNFENNNDYFVDYFSKQVMDNDGNVYKVMSLQEIKQELKKDHGIN